MAKIIFKIGKAKEHGRSPIEVILIDETRRKLRMQAGPSKCKAFFRETTDNTDNLLSTLDTLLKKSKIKLESVKDIKIKAHKEAGLTSTRIIKAIAKALSFEL